MKNIKISGVFTLFVATLVAFDADGWVITLLMAAVIHEVGHIAAILAFGGRLEGFEASMAGCRILYTEGRQTAYGLDIIFALSGPMFNVLAIIAALLLPSPGEEIYYFVGTNLILALLNLLPIYSLDGGKIAYAILAQSVGIFKAEKACLWLSGVAGMGLTGCVIAVLTLSGFNIALIVAGIVIFFTLCNKTALQKPNIPL